MITQIIPVSVFPGSATTLYVRAGGLGPPPSFYYELSNADGVALKNGNVAMTEDQWNAWAANADDESYILSCVATNLNLTEA